MHTDSFVHELCSMLLMFSLAKGLDLFILHSSIEASN